MGTLREYYLQAISSPYKPRSSGEYCANKAHDALCFLSPFGFFDFVHLEQNAFCVLTDSGTIQEECCILRVPNVTIRDVTERPETVETGNNMLCGAESNMIIQCVRTAVTQIANWRVPAEYLVADVSTAVSKIVLGYKPGM